MTAHSGTLSLYIWDKKIIKIGSQVWLAVSGGEDMKNASPDLYERLLQSPHNAEIADIIKTDLPRTFPDNIFFNNTENQQHELYNVLLAFAHQNKIVGYCQVNLHF